MRSFCGVVCGYRAMPSGGCCNGCGCKSQHRPMHKVLSANARLMRCTRIPQRSTAAHTQHNNAAWCVTHAELMSCDLMNTYNVCALRTQIALECPSSSFISVFGVRHYKHSPPVTMPIITATCYCHAFNKHSGDVRVHVLSFCERALVLRHARTCSNKI